MVFLHLAIMICWLVFLYTLLSLEVHLVSHLSKGSPYFLSFAMNIGYELLYSTMLWF